MDGAYERLTLSELQWLIFVFACEAHPTQWTWCEQASEEYLGGTVPILFTYTFHVNTADNLMNTKMWFYRQKRSQNLPNLSAYLRSRMCEYKHYNKSSLEHMFFPVTSIQPTCSLRPACTHTLRKTTEMKGGACWQADQGQQGLFDQWCGPSGHWALTAYATAPTYRETNPHFISHICSIVQNKLTPEQETN